MLHAGSAGGISQADFGAGGLIAMRTVSALLHFYFLRMAATSSDKQLIYKRIENTYSMKKSILRASGLESYFLNEK